MEENKKYVSFKLILGICVLIPLIMILLLVIHKNSSEYNVINGNIHIMEDGVHIANDRQFEASARMFTWNGKLFFYPYGYHVKQQYYRELCVLEEDSIVSLGQMDMLYAARNEYVYYGKIDHNDTRHEKLMCYNLFTKEHEHLATINTFDWHDIIFCEDEALYFPDDSNPTGFFLVQDGKISELIHREEAFKIDDRRYTIEDSSVVVYDKNNNKETLRRFTVLGSLCIIPCTSGLLVYNEGSSDLLYYIPKGTSELVELLSFPGFSSDSAVNIYDNWVYISFERYEAFGDLGPEKSERDSTKGLYRINLENCSVEKLNDVVYDGLYVFDDTGIYACKDGCIYKIDFDGNEIMTILS